MARSVSSKTRCSSKNLVSVANGPGPGLRRGMPPPEVRAAGALAAAAAGRLAGVSAALAGAFAGAFLATGAWATEALATPAWAGTLFVAALVGVALVAGTLATEALAWAGTLFVAALVGVALVAGALFGVVLIAALFGAAFLATVVVADLEAADLVADVLATAFVPAFLAGALAVHAGALVAGVICSSSPARGRRPPPASRETSGGGDDTGTPGGRQNFPRRAPWRAAAQPRGSLGAPVRLGLRTSSTWATVPLEASSAADESASPAARPRLRAGSGRPWPFP